MNLESILTHMNEHHTGELKALVSRYGGFQAKEAKLTNVSTDGLSILADGTEVFAPFPTPTQPSDYKNAIIALCTGLEAQKSAQTEDIAKEIESFKDTFNSILLASLSLDNLPHLSYSPLLRYEGAYYLYISEVAQHFANLKANPKRAQVMFIQDEKESQMLLARKRLTYDVSVEFLPRDAHFEKVYDSFESRVGKGGGVSAVRGMLDFHLVRVHFGQGRFVKGFGQAYEVNPDGSIAHIGGKGMPHTMPHKGSNKS
ncbi:HugZ family heme oxygenase [uncultured Helicobacter sp.]|uniref:HugZ family heme oxygenase n=1 Tax=uncultured Helicobacter sp. TaxID=175537 RepID=UPI00375248E1